MININFPLTAKCPKRELIIGTLAICVLATIAIDMLNALLNQTSFYFTESFLFSSFWWIFIPLLVLQYHFSHQYKSIRATIWLMILPMLLHFFAYPAIVWLLSTVFYNHSFAYRQTLLYELELYSFILMIAYTLPLVLSRMIKQQYSPQPAANPLAISLPQTGSISSLLVSDGKKKILIQTADIQYISASSPYIQIHLDHKKYLHNQSLKSISLQLGEDCFIRIHKSCIVNIKMVTAYTSRQNGDYDITLANDIQLRLSRNYAALFRQKMETAHQVTA